MNSIMLVLCNFKVGINILYKQLILKITLLYWILICNWIFSSYLTNNFLTITLFLINLINVRLNYYSLLILFTVLLITSFVIFNSIDYLTLIDSYLFLFYLTLFELVMMLFILFNDIIMIFLNWELLGLISYLLINYWTNKVNCGIKAILYNRLGDYAFLYILSIIVSLLIINYYSFITLSLVTFIICFIYYFSLNFLFNYLLLISLLCILFSKSAQFPFSSWLLYAMNAPTPISALLHSSTMVIASLYLAIIIN